MVLDEHAKARAGLVVGVFVGERRKRGSVLIFFPRLGRFGNDEAAYPHSPGDEGRGPATTVNKVRGERRAVVCTAACTTGTLGELAHLQVSLVAVLYPKLPT